MGTSDTHGLGGCGGVADDGADIMMWGRGKGRGMSNKSTMGALA